MAKQDLPKVSSKRYAGFKEGDTVRCVFAATQFYTVGKEYEVVLDPVTLTPAIQADDGLYDPTTLVLSKFEKI